MVTCDIPLKSNFHTSSMTSGPLLPFLKCLLLDFFVISSFYSAIDMLRCGTWRWRTEKRRGKNNMKKRVTEGEKYEVQDSKWWSTEEFEETEGKGEKLTNLKLCWILWRHTHRSIYISPPFHMSKIHHHFIALDHFYVFVHMIPRSASVLYWV